MTPVKKIIATASCGLIIAGGVIATPAQAAPFDYAPVVIESLDGVDYAAIATTIPGYNEFVASINTLGTQTTTAASSVVAAEKSFNEALAAIRVLEKSVNAPLPATIGELNARGKEFANDIKDAQAKYDAADTAVRAAYDQVIIVRNSAQSSITLGKTVIVNAEAILRDPSISPATREAAMDALAVVAGNLAQNEDVIAAATAVLAKVEQVRAAAAKAEATVKQAGEAAAKAIAAEKAFEKAATDAIAQAKVAAEKAIAQAEAAAAKAVVAGKAALAQARQTVAQVNPFKK